MAADSSPSDFGAKLHQARESRGVSLGRIAHATKIPVGMLQALERNDISRLPGGVLGRGFVRSFATEVGLDPEASVAEFVTQFPANAVTVGYPTLERRAEDAVVETRRSAPRTLLVVAAGTVLLLAAVPVYFVATRARALNDAAVQRMSDTAQTVASERAVAPVMLTTPVRVLVPAERTATPLGLIDISALSTATFAGFPRVLPATGASTAIPALPTPALAPTAAESTPILIVLAAIRSSWVIATVDGEKAFSRLFEAGEQETLTGRDLVVTAGDAGAIALTVNGAAARSLGRPGETVTARVNRTSLKKYLAPR